MTALSFNLTALSYTDYRMSVTTCMSTTIFGERVK
jgi:hypothetical protein